jgi:hypothetical protein
MGIERKNQIWACPAVFIINIEKEIASEDFSRLTATYSILILISISRMLLMQVYV